MLLSVVHCCCCFPLCQGSMCRQSIPGTRYQVEAFFRLSDFGLVIISGYHLWALNKISETVIYGDSPFDL
jgi:hypothetical protein